MTHWRPFLWPGRTVAVKAMNAYLGDKHVADSVSAITNGQSSSRYLESWMSRPYVNEAPEQYSPVQGPVPAGSNAIVNRESLIGV